MVSFQSILKPAVILLILQYACTTSFTLTIYIDEGDDEDKDELLVSVFRAWKVQRFCVGNVFKEIMWRSWNGRNGWICLPTTWLCTDLVKQLYCVAKSMQMALWTLPLPDYIFLRPWNWCGCKKCKWKNESVRAACHIQSFGWYQFWSQWKVSKLRQLFRMTNARLEILPFQTAMWKDPTLRRWTDM